MSTFYRCDRCKKEFIKKPNTIELNIHDMGLDINMDLCEDCSSGFRYWAKNPNPFKEIFDNLSQDNSRFNNEIKETADEKSN